MPGAHTASMGSVDYIWSPREITSALHTARADGETMLAQTPPMGWNSWNTFGPHISEELVRQTADALLESGLKDAGYEYVVIDDL